MLSVCRVQNVLAFNKTFIKCIDTYKIMHEFTIRGVVLRAGLTVKNTSRLKASCPGHDKLFVRVKTKDLRAINDNERLDDLNVVVSTPHAKEILNLDVGEVLVVQMPEVQNTTGKQIEQSKEFRVSGKRSLVDKYSGFAHRALILVNAL